MRQRGLNTRAQKQPSHTSAGKASRADAAAILMRLMIMRGTGIGGRAGGGAANKAAKGRAKAAGGPVRRGI